MKHNNEKALKCDVSSVSQTVSNDSINVNRLSKNCAICCKSKFSRQLHRPNVNFPQAFSQILWKTDRPGCALWLRWIFSGRELRGDETPRACGKLGNSSLNRSYPFDYRCLFHPVDECRLFCTSTVRRKSLCSLEKQAGFFHRCFIPKMLNLKQLKKWVLARFMDCICQQRMNLIFCRKIVQFGVSWIDKVICCLSKPDFHRVFHSKCG